MNGHTVRDALATIARETGSEVPRYARRLAPGRLQYSRSERRAILAYARNVSDILETASETHWRDGLGWYAAAYDSLRPYATGYGIWRASTALAACSPGMVWRRNLDALAAVIDAAQGTPLRDALAARGVGVPYSYGHFIRAVDALRGIDVLKGDKVRAFRDGVAYRGLTYSVAIDGHAALAATHGSVERRPGIGTAPSLGAPAYDVLASAYATVGHSLGIVPSAIQAVVWLAWRDIPLAARSR